MEKYTCLQCCQGSEELGGWVIDGASSLAVHDVHHGMCFMPSPALFRNGLDGKTMDGEGRITEKNQSSMSVENGTVQNSPIKQAKKPIIVNKTEVTSTAMKRSTVNTESIKKRSKRRRVLNKGEIQLMEYHANVREFILETTQTLVTLTQSHACIYVCIGWFFWFKFANA